MRHYWCFHVLDMQKPVAYIICGNTICDIV
nr:MAG TPA: hypothetical protein [Caudoviricetes sp.]